MEKVNAGVLAYILACTNKSETFSIYSHQN